MQAFADNPWFRSLAPADAEALLAASTPVTLAQGALLFCQDDPFDAPFGAFFGAVSGRIKLSILHPAGKEVILAVVEPGNWFGAGPVLDHRPRAHTATALSDVELRAVSAARFDELMHSNGFARAIARQVAQRLRMAYGTMGDSALLSTQERIMRRLRALAHGDMTLSADGRSTVSASQDTLAMMLGISRPTLNKELQALARRGLISLRYGEIELHEAARQRKPRPARP
ncbi:MULTISPECIES: Crp/Fnr family transcriptional regulator [unclassified Bradyrhizobium]|uniref:Crp/Fnr family transcriptional regulator n=1 Tax=unclassified Bradyrhizobium TaxID=2631580 RepID=UPI002013975B|nr:MULTISPECIES: Crp/Fnr family transcriptional regulator [unclassified Bradyrhizobium]